MNEAQVTSDKFLTYESSGTLIARRIRGVWRGLSRNPTSIIGLLIAILMIIVAILAPIISPYPYEEMDLANRTQGPARAHLLGTDHFGRDILSRMIWGARASLLVGFAGIGIAMTIGTVIGVWSGFFGGWFDEIIMRGMDIILSFPYIVLAVALIAMVGPSLRNVILVLAITRTPRFARLVRASTLALKEFEFVTAARAIGQTNLGIIYRHILANCLTPIIVMSSLDTATAIITESSLSFLGLGIQPPMPSWGNMIADGRRFLMDAPWIATFPGLAISLTILGFNLFGDGLRDILDPRLRGRE
jgi:peptide/nickel transport system permease protein